MGQAGLEKLRKLPLTRLNLSCCDWLVDVGLEAILNFPLTDLDISWCPEATTDIGLLLLADLPLTKLALSSHNGSITDEGLSHLQGMKNLTWLDLSGHMITDIGAILTLAPTHCRFGFIFKRAFTAFVNWAMRIRG